MRGRRRVGGVAAARYHSGTTTPRNRANGGALGELKSQVSDSAGTAGQVQHSYDIFEGTEQIQQLVIARAISGLRIE